MSPPDPDGVVVMVMAALPEEVGVLRWRLADARRLPKGPGSLRRWEGRIGDHRVRVVVTGDGAAQARSGARVALDQLPGETTRCRHLIVAGVAGAADPALRAHDLVVAREVVLEGGVTRRADEAMVAKVMRETGAVPGRVLTRERLAASVAHKQQIHEEWSRGDSLPTVVDLETAWYLEEVERRGVPWTVVRVVSDAADEPLPAFLEGCRDEGGAIRRGRVAWHALRHPGTIPPLLRLARRVRQCTVVLAEAVALIVGLDAKEDVG